MTLITFEDGKPLMKDDGKIGTEQACCCECACQFDNFTSTFTNDDQCNLDYISVEIEFGFEICGNALSEAEFILNSENNWSETKQVEDENGTKMQAQAFLKCGFINGQSNKYYLLIAVSGLEFPCVKLCDDNFFTISVSSGLITGNLSRDGTCCPDGASGGSGQLEVVNCPGAYVAVTNYSIVLS